jgi:hypothetical protein
MESQHKPNQTKKVSIDVNKLTTEQSFIIVHNLIHKAQRSGAFLLDEAVVAKHALVKLKDSLNLGNK